MALYFERGIDRSRDYRSSFESFGSALMQAFIEAGITTVTDQVQTVSFEQDLFGLNSNWNADIIADEDSSDFARLYLYDANDNTLRGTYIVDVSTEISAPKKGIFVYVEPDAIIENPSTNLRFVAIAFDFTNASENTMLMRVDDLNTLSGQFYTFHLHYQCNIETKACVGEYLDTPGESLAREFGTTVRYSWNDTDKKCVSVTQTINWTQ